MWAELVRLCNEQFHSAQFTRLLSANFTKARAQQFSIQMAYYVQNRRDCWGYVQGSAPLDVKQLIWHHEEDELIGQKAQGKVDHITLAVKEGEVLGLSAEAFERTARLEGGGVCFSASFVGASGRLEAIGGSAILEMRNSANSFRRLAVSTRRRHVGKRSRHPDEKADQQCRACGHGCEHAHLLMQVARKHATTDTARAAILRGARENLMIDRVFAATWPIWWNHCPR
jgi:hypothetical protein